MNHLQNEKSPYLRQHRDQPVDWYPWGDEVFSKAKAENKPVLLSIGYSTCHWCHVMAQESFEDEEVAKKLNSDFIAIKLDREERPDIDSIYMKVCQGLTGSGGWPLTILMTPDQHPFFAATYLPTAPFLNLLNKVSQKWQEEPSGLRNTGRQIVDWLQAVQTEPEDDAPALDTLYRQAYRWFQRTYDKKWGGFGRAPKFPSAHNLLFLLQMAESESDAAGKTDHLSGSAMVHHTLRCMAQGGMYDHLGGGLSRYSTDEKWLVPHFEKTLYDNALLAMAYSEAGYGSIACEILDYVLRELTHPEGGFYCGQDADSDGEEGKFYLWTEDEIKQKLGKEKGEQFCHTYQIEPSGIPNRIGQSWSEESPMKEEEQILAEYRKERCELGLDDKILTSWNGLMMAAMAVVGRQQNRIDYILAAEKAAGFTRAHLTRSSGRLWHRFSDGETAHMGQLSDYAYYAYGLLELFRSTQKADYLQQAMQIAQWMEMLFADEAKGGYYETAKDSENLIARLKETDDGALPSSNSVAAFVLADLGALTGERRWREAADKQAYFCRRAAQNAPAGSSFFLWAMLRKKAQSKLLVCVSADEDYVAPPLKADVRLMVKTAANGQTLGEVAPFTKEYPIPAENTMYYLCENGACKLPSREVPMEVLEEHEQV